MLLFDEADALFGQRTRVRDAHDRFANIEIDYLLQRMDTFDGIAVLATNRKGDLDPAFLRRLGSSSTSSRRRRPSGCGCGARAAGTHLGRRAGHRGRRPCPGWLEHLELTGAEIKAVALAAAFHARAGGELIATGHVWARPGRTRQARLRAETNGVHRPGGPR